MPPVRFKRDAIGNSSLEKNGTSDWELFKFRVQMPEEPKRAVKNFSVSGEFLLLLSMFGLCLLVATILGAIYVKRKKSQY